MKSLLVIIVALVTSGLCAPPEPVPKLGTSVRRMVDLGLKFLNCSIQEDVQSIYYDAALDEIKKLAKRSFKRLGTDLNITELKLHDIGKYEIFKSDYNEETNHFGFEIKFDGPRFEGAYTAKTQVNQSVFSLDLDAKYNFTVLLLPVVVKIEWSFGKNESTKPLIIEDYKFQGNLIGSETFGSENVKSGSIFEYDEKLEENFKIYKKEFVNLVESFILNFLKSSTKKYYSVDELSIDLMKETKINFVLLRTCIKNGSAVKILDD